VSIKAMESVGCQKEGILRGIFPAINGIGRTDGILMSILKNEWTDKVKQELKNKLNKKPTHNNV
jgi:RimJ/RimL family protein N-acetyltransferase